MMNGLSRVLWARVWAIALVQGGVMVMWLIYRLYLGALLKNWGFSAELAAGLLTVEMVLGLVMEPLFGALSDQQQRSLGTRFPLIVLGVILSAFLFLMLPLLLFFPITEATRFLLPLVAIAWAIAMTLFRSPTMVLLGQCAPAAQLPWAMGVISLVAGVLGAFRPPISQWLLSLGSLNCFLLGSLVLVGASIFLKQVLPPITISPEEAVDTPLPLPWMTLLNIALLAIAVTWGSRILGLVLTNQMQSINNGFMGLQLLLAVIVLPVGWLIQKTDQIMALVAALGLLTLTLVGLVNGLWLPILAFCWVVGSSILNNGLIPLFLNILKCHWIGLGIGLYFGVSGMAMEIFTRYWATQNRQIQETLGVSMLLIAALLCIQYLPQIKRLSFR